ncbi:hypothetical protein D6J61_26155, partial [Salmonella enterica subsp. enterica serovar Alachua]|nr:hypothetical protein [Salmonella enterica subsp. enterica serovar Alachua]
MKTNLFIFTLAAVFTGITTYIFFPGLMSYDSLDQYRQAKGIIPLNSHHPIIMTYLWSGLMSFWDHAGIFLIIQQLLYWSGAAAISCLIGRTPLIKISLFLVVGLLPPLFIHSVHIWKDVGLNICATLVLAAILADVVFPRRNVLFIAAIPLFYSFTVRSNAPFGMFPLVLLWSWRAAAYVELPGIRS